MATAPIRNKRQCQRFSGRPAAMPASAADHQQGRRRSHQPIGRSMRASRRKGRSRGGARRSTQLPEGASGTGLSAADGPGAGTAALEGTLRELVLARQAGAAEETAAARLLGLLLLLLHGGLRLPRLASLAL